MQLKSIDYCYCPIDYETMGRTKSKKKGHPASGVAAVPEPAAVAVETNQIDDDHI